MTGTAPCPFDLDQPAAYARWREARLSMQPQRVDDLIVEVADPRCLSADERIAMLDRCARANMVVYRSQVTLEDKSLPLRLGAQLGLTRLDANWLSDDEGISHLQVRPGIAAGQDYIPYTSRPLGWHTDGYYNPPDPALNFANEDNTAGSTITGPAGQSYQYTPARPYLDNYSDTLADIAMYYWKRDLHGSLANRVPTSVLRRHKRWRVRGTRC